MAMYLQGTYSEVASISNLGSATEGPVVEERGSLLLEYVNGSTCITSDGKRTNYTTRIHLVCSRGGPVRRNKGEALACLGLHLFFAGDGGMNPSCRPCSVALSSPLLIHRPWSLEVSFLLLLQACEEAGKLKGRCQG